VVRILPQEQCMPSNAALAISGERQFLRRMVTGLTAAGGAVQAVETLQDAYPHLPDTYLVFYHATTLPDENIRKLATILKGGRRLAVLVPRPGIGDMLEPLSLDQVTSVAAVGAADGATLAGIASRSFYGNIFGLERYLPYGVRAHATLIGDYHEKAIAMGTISSFGRAMNVRRKYLENIERVADELLMNALYDAPLVASQLGLIDPAAASGASLPQDRLVLQYACDGELFALGVTDHFGALQKPTLIEYVGRCLTSARPLNQETGAGAGLGLYLVCNSVSQLIFNVSPGVATEVIALFNLRAPKLRLTHISFSSETADASRVPVLAAGQRRALLAANGARPAATPLSVKIVLAVTVLVLLTAGGLLLWNKLTPDTRGHLVVITDPPGAQITVDGAARGESPGRGQGLLVANLAAGRHTVVARKAGYAAHDAVEVTVPAGRRARVTIRLRRLPAALKIFSSPPGAAVRLDGKPRGKTPLVLSELVGGRAYRVSLTKAGYQPERRMVTAPAPGTTDAQVFDLRFSPDWGHLWLTTNVPVRDVQLDGQPVGLSLPLKAFRVALGKHTLLLRNRWPYLNHEVKFEVPRAGHEARLELLFGRIRPAGAQARVFWDGRYHKHEILAPVGQYTLAVKSGKTGKARRRRVLVRKGQIARVRP
jgi:hypothetical protein